MSAEEIKLKHEIAESEAKDKLVLEYLDLCMKFTDAQTISDQQTEIKVRLNKIRSQLGMDLIK